MIIGLTGLAGSGKSTVANVLQDEWGYEIVPFAGPLKKMARAFGLTAREMTFGKEEPCEALCGKTPRQFMQLLGTEFGRQMIGENFWVHAWRRSVGEIAEDSFGPLLVVADDVRFPNEVAAIHAMGGQVWRVKRPGEGSKTGAGHASENPDALLHDLVIDNDGDIDDLMEKVKRALEASGFET